MVKNLSEEDRQVFDDAILSRPVEADPETGLKPPSFWKGEDDAAASAAAFLSATRR